MTNVNLRQATTADSEFAFETKKASMRTYIEMVWGWDEAKQRQLHERRFSEHTFQVIQYSGRDVGIMDVVREPDCIWVYKLFVLPEHQGKGIGRTCMTRVIADADRDGLPVRLSVLKVNTQALSFYRRLRFEEIGRTDTHVEMERRPPQREKEYGCSCIAPQSSV